MGQLTRDGASSSKAEDDDLRPATYTSDRGWTYRLLPSGDEPGAWRVYPQASGALAWLGPGWPGYIAVPQRDACHGYDVYREAAGAGGTRQPAGYAGNLGDMCWPVELDLLSLMSSRPTDQGTQAAQ
jgi:hypothetical protein